MGNVCTRGCTFCAVSKGSPKFLDPEEPRRVAEAAVRLDLNHVVVTSVTRDDIPDGGAAHFVETIKAIRHRLSDASIEVLVPDFGGNSSALDVVLKAQPDVLNHNLETVPRLYPVARPGASYSGSLALIKQAADRQARTHDGAVTKSGLMVGLGETPDEIRRVLRDLRQVGCQILTIGQYLQPTRKHLPVARFYTPDEFAGFKEEGLALGFRHVESGPLVRSSYMAHRALHVVEDTFHKA
jgi:lipoic acid synthetase